MLAMTAAAGQSAPRATEQDFFALAERRLAWLGQRQRVVAQNIANADTPGFVPRDVTPFARYLAGTSVTPARTNPLHLAPAGAAAGMPTLAEAPSERAPDGNAVSLDHELETVAQDEGDAAIAGNLWKSTMGLYLAALGRGQG